ncbi:MAG: L-histidine N(alpha)-methyltransferase [Gemmatimonadota bacterium]|nr:L-histidine N(alpha)-methyltransferase [Gemmatimonadota bacterium]
MTTQNATTPPDVSDLPPHVAERVERIWSLAYQATTTADLQDLYAEWSATYDEDHDAIGFFGHHRTAEVLQRHLNRPDVARVLDAGAGTGAAGEALHALGFRELHAVDLSPAMLDVARAKGLYRSVGVADLSVPVDRYRTDSFDAAVLVGVFSYGQAPAEALDEILRLVRPGGLVVFTLRTDFHEEDAMGVRSRMERLEAEGIWSLVECTDPEPYLPGKDPDARFRVWCYRVTGAPDAEVEDGFAEAARDAFASDDGVVRFDHAWIWDSVASRLYDRYTRTDEYYLSGCEEEILASHARDIWDEESLLVELGCGSARKISHVLEVCAWAAQEPVTYIPIDVSQGALDSTEQDIRARFGERVRVDPRQGLFEDVLAGIPARPRKLLFFLGSSLGNLESIPETVAFLHRLRERMGPEDRLVVGVDLDKDAEVLDAAYNRNEACRRFFAHMVRRINEHLGADFDPRGFELASTYVAEPEHRGIRTRRVNLRVAPREPQSSWITALEEEVRLEAGQPIQVGISRKFTPAALLALARAAGFSLRRQWLDRRGWFSLNELLPGPLTEPA